MSEAAFKKRIAGFLAGVAFGGAVSQVLAHLIVIMLRSPRLDALWTAGPSVAGTAALVSAGLGAVAVVLFRRGVARGAGGFWMGAFIALFVGALTAPMHYIGS